MVHLFTSNTKNLMRRLFLYCVAIVALASCGGGDGNGVVVVTGDDEIGQIACEAAERIAGCDRKDTLAMQNAIMEARAERSTFAISGNDKAALTYDEALRKRLGELDKNLCDTIFANKNDQ